MPARKPISSLSQWIRDQVAAPWAMVTGDPDAYVQTNISPGRATAIASATVAWQAIAWDCKMRIRLAMFLQSICVTSERDGLLSTGNRHHDLHFFTDWAMEHAFSTYRKFLLGVTHSPLMGTYLTFFYSTKDAPDENYAREIMQLFTRGLYAIDRDGKVTDRPTYDAASDVTELARVFTGWTTPFIHHSDGRERHRYEDSDQGSRARRFYLSDDGAWNGLFNRTRLMHDRIGEYPQFMGEGVGLWTEPWNHDFSEINLTFGTIPSDQAAIDALGDIRGNVADWQAAEQIMFRRIRAAHDLLLDTTDPQDGMLVSAKYLTFLLITNHVTRDFSGEYFRRVYDALVTGVYTLPDGSLIGSGESYDMLAAFSAMLCDVEARASDNRPETWGRLKPDFLRLIQVLSILISEEDAAGPTPAIIKNSVVTTGKYRSGIGTGFGSFVVNGRPLDQPNVFGHYDQISAPSNTIFSDRNITAGELSAINQQNIGEFIEFLDDVARMMLRESKDGVITTGVRSPTVRLDLKRWYDLRDDAGAMVDAIASEFIGEPLSADVRARLIDIVEGVDARDKDFRVREAFIGVLTSPQYLIQM